MKYITSKLIIGLILLVNVNTVSAEDLTEERCEYPVWSVKSPELGYERIAYALVSRVYGTQIWVVRVDSIRHKIMLTSKNWNRHPSFSWDGRRIAYAGGDDNGIQQIWVMEDDGTGAIKLTNSDEDKLYPVFSPNGDKLAFISVERDVGKLYIINVKEGAEPQLITKCGSIGKNTVLSPVTWSPDGKNIAFVKLDNEYKNENIYSVNIYTKEEKQLTFTGYIGSGISWSPDGNSIAYVSPDKNNKTYSVYILDLPSREIKEVITAVTPLGVCFSPDSKKICFLRNYQVWVSEVTGKNQKQITTQEIVRDLKGWELRKTQNREALLKLKEYIGKKVWLRRTIQSTTGEKLEKLTEALIINVRNKILLPEKYRLLDDSRLTIEIELKILGKKFFVVYLYEITGYIDDFARFFFLTNPYETYHWNDAIWKAIKERNVLVGMNKEQVLLSLGEPTEILKSGRAVNELWNYRFIGTVSFENDVVKEFKPVTTIKKPE